MTGKVRGRIHRRGQSDITDDDNDMYADLEDEHQQNLGGGSDEAGDSPVIGELWVITSLAWPTRD